MIFSLQQEIDTYIAQAKDSGYETLVRVSRNSLSIAAETMMKTAITVSITMETVPCTHILMC